MKLPFQPFAIVTINLPEPLKQELRQWSFPRYIWIALDEPISQIGRDFLFVVVPVQPTPDFDLKPTGPGVLCQTEAEAKESVELLSLRDGEHIGVIQSAGFGTVGKIKGFRSVITEHSVRSLQIKGGKKWLAFERQIDRATGEVIAIRRADAPNQVEATRIAKQWLQEYQRERQLSYDSSSKSKTPPPPPRCTPLTQSDLEDDLPAAKWAGLKRQWPHSFEILEARKANPKPNVSAQDCQDAYLLDLVEQGYNPKAETIRADLRLCQALTKAAKRFTTGKRRRIADLAIYLIAFNWALGWCYLSDAEIAKRLSGILNKAFTPVQIKHYRSRELGLVAKHIPGPRPKAL